MAKKQTVSKAQAVRDYLKASPKATPLEVVAALNEARHQDHGGACLQHQDHAQQGPHRQENSCQATIAVLQSWRSP